MALGANLPYPGLAPAETVAAALLALGALGRVEPGRPWRSPAWPPGGPPFVNACARVDLAHGATPEEALAALHEIEARFGRERGARWGARTLDLDLLSLDGPEGPIVAPDAGTWAVWAGLDAMAQAQEAPGEPILPHPRLQDRAFVLLPLLDVAPGWRHPILGLTAREMAAVLPPEARDGVEPL